MCRLLGIISTKEISPYYYLFDSKFSLFKQAEFEYQNDGWGICCYKNGKINFLSKSINYIVNEVDIVKSLVKNLFSSISILFVRKASNPRNINKDLLLTIDATQPFVYNNISFVHNGAINIPDQILEHLNYEIKPRSLNDSEVYFITFMKFFDEEKNVFQAIKKTRYFIEKIFKEVETNKEVPYSSLNVIISDGNKLYAYNRYLSKYKKSLADSQREYYKMCFNIKYEFALISSEPLDDEWIDLGDGKFLEIWIENEKVKYKVLED